MAGGGEKRDGGVQRPGEVRRKGAQKGHETHPKIGRQGEPLVRRRKGKKTHLNMAASKQIKTSKAIIRGMMTPNTTSRGDEETRRGGGKS